MVCSDVSDRLGTGPTGPTGPSDGSRNDRIWLARVELLVASGILLCGFDVGRYHFCNIPHIRKMKECFFWL